MSAGPSTFAIEQVCFDDLGPRRVMHFHDPASRLLAVVVIDTMWGGPTGGGVRMAPDLTLGEVARLGRAMTYKFALLGLPIGGAKAGIWLDPADPGRDEVVAAFSAAIRPLREAGAFIPGPDMGTSGADFPSPLRSEVALDERLTGYGLVVAARTAVELRGGSLEGRRVAIEGFGKVGAAAAKFFADEGALVVAVSTVRATVHDPSGLDVDAMIDLRREHGDGGVERTPRAKLLPREALFTLDADVLVPGARPDAIHAGNVHDLRASVIVPGSNAPYAIGTLETLAARGIVALPDFVSNAGGVLAMIAAPRGLQGDGALAMVRAAIEANVRRIDERARRTGAHLYDAAIALARELLPGGAEAQPSSPPPNARSAS